VFYVNSQRQQFLAKSTDAGQHFSAPVAVSPIFQEVAFSASYRTDSFAALAVGPASTGGEVFMVYSDYAATVGAEVEFVAIDPATLAFTGPLVLNDVSAGQQFFPAIAADQTSGTLVVSWFDTRNSGGSNNLYDVYATYSTGANGASFAPN